VKKKEFLKKYKSKEDTRINDVIEL